MDERTAAEDRLPVLPLSYGPLYALEVRVHELANAGRAHEALTAADESEPLARAFGDDRTVGFLIQGRIYSYLYLGYYAEAFAAGQELLEHHRAAGNILGEAKTLAILAEACFQADRIAEGVQYLARSSLLLDDTTRRNDRYISALGSYSDAAARAGLYEIAGSALEREREYVAARGEAVGGYMQERYLDLLVCWGMRLRQLGHETEAVGRLRRAAALAAGWLEAERREAGADSRRALELAAYRALALAGLGETGEPVALAAPVVVPLRDQDLREPAWAAHLASGIALGARGEPAAARRELLAARQLCLDGWTEKRLIVQHELSALAARNLGAEDRRDMLDTILDQARLLWRQRLQRLAMLRQARRREELEAAHARAEAASLHDPLTGLGNRRRFDQLMAALDTGAPSAPASLLIIDVDMFKRINDTHSHAAGDQVLREIGGILRGHCRAQDVPVRYAGDEFAVFLRADLTAAVEIAERIRAAVAATGFDHVTPGTVISISTGAAQLEPHMSAADLFHAADANLYQAKRGGRNRVAA
ncbi:GGDEF domain-containing protein [Planobispora takensis]|uniref:GGDEF domain-containing protein n=1 Tax=Planobispora takensis TaxID=1367882 RepID=A0A8J3SY08_9ACTN|nr:GGDEF domain-containing protein [Planobispora takensis]GII00390.1 hypothetical protein Pta02_23980 [Planobispora takensis]